LITLLHGGVDDGGFAIDDRELVSGAEEKRQRLQVVEAGDDVGGAAGQFVFDVLGLACIQRWR
jgi:hypothetical protein